MAGATTRSKSSKRKKVEHFPDKDTVVDDGTDRISNLPDSLLCHILSFLPTINAVATAILSSRWKSLWILVPTLYLDDGSISRRLFRCRTHSAVEPISFTHVVSRVLALHIAPLLRNFSLAICSPCHPFHIDTWINTGIARNVQQLLLKIYLNGDSRGEFYDGELCELPRSFYTFKTVVVLKLTGGILIDPPPSFQLSSLEILTLNKIFYKNDESFSRLLSGCPVLETLRVSRDCKDGMIDLKVSVPTLKHLDLDFNSYEPGLPDYKLEIYSPALGYFRFQGDLRNVVFLEKLSNLVEAQVDIHAIANPDNYGDYKYEIFYGDRVFKLLKALNNAKFLSLYPGEEECFGFGSIYPSRFQNLVRLKFDVKICNWHVLQALLLVAPNLEVLDVKKKYYACKNRLCWMEPPDGPGCLSSHLTTFIFDCFCELEDEVEFIKYILKEAVALKTMTIHVSWRLSKEYVLKKLSMFPRHSTTCILTVL